MNTENHIGPPAGSGGGRTVRAGFLEKVMPELVLKDEEEKPGKAAEDREKGRKNNPDRENNREASAWRCESARHRGTEVRAARWC